MHSPRSTRCRRGSTRRCCSRRRAAGCSTSTTSAAASGPPAVEASGVRTPGEVYDLRSTFASDALHAGVSVFQLARIMGTSVRMIERHYGALLDGAGAEIAGRLDALDAQRQRDDEARAEDGWSRLGHYWVTARNRSSPSRIRLCNGKRLMAFEPTTFCMASSADGYDDRRRGKTDPACRHGFRPLRTTPTACRCGLVARAFGSLVGHGRLRPVAAEAASRAHTKRVAIRHASA